MNTMTQRLPKSFFQQKMEGLRIRLTTLKHFLEKATDTNRRQQIQKEIDSTTLTLKKTELDSCFSRLDEEMVD